MLAFMAIFLGSTNTLQAQYRPSPPYNPYMNPSYQLGQQLGQAMAHNSKYGRKKFCKAIKKRGQCNNGSLSLEYGAVAIFGRNGYYCSATVDKRISSKLKSIKKSGGNITDVNILENGKFIIVYNNGCDWYGVLPDNVASALDDYSYNVKYKSISFNEIGTYAITTSNGFKSNNSIYQSFYDDNAGKYGELLSVNICGEGAVFCYSDGARYCGRIPSNVEAAIRNFSHTPSFVKFNKKGDYLICDQYGSYSYSIGDASRTSRPSTVFYDYARIKREQAAREIIRTETSTTSYSSTTSMSTFPDSSVTVSTATTTSVSNSILYSGLYNQNSQGYNISTGLYTGIPGPDFEVRVEVYRDSIIVLGTRYEYEGTSGQWKMYSLDNGDFWGKYVYFIDQNNNMKLHVIRRNIYTGETEVTVYTMTKDGTQNRKVYGNEGGLMTGTSNGSSTLTTQQSTTSSSSRTGTRPICTTCHGSGKCNSCHGNGKRTDNAFGTGTNYSKTCGVCGGNGRCPVCGGSGHK